VLSNHLEIANFLEKEMNNPLKKELERQPVKKKHNLSRVIIFNFFATKDPFKKDDV